MKKIETFAVAALTALFITTIIAPCINAGNLQAKTAETITKNNITQTLNYGDKDRILIIGIGRLIETQKEDSRTITIGISCGVGNINNEPKLFFSQTIRYKNFEGIAINGGLTFLINGEGEWTTPYP